MPPMPETPVSETPAPKTPVPKTHRPQTVRQVAGYTRWQLADEARTRVGRGHGRSAEIFKQVMHGGLFQPEQCGLSEAACGRWRSAYACDLPRVVQVIDEPFASSIEGAQTAKAIVALADQRRVEMVRIPMGHGRYTLCLSSQVGCKRACSFCETGRLGLLRNLSTAEIIGQYLVAQHQLHWNIRNVVFMGMGEALDNYPAVEQALRVLNDRSGIGLSQERITVCTVGNVPGIQRLAASKLRRVGLSLSLNATDDATRQRIMPIAHQYPLAAVQQALIAYRPRKNFAFGINYCLMPGINDQPGVESQIADFCAPLGRSLVNVIPYNPGTEALCPTPSHQQVDIFVQRLRTAGCAVRRRVTKGRDVMAACGQLGDLQQRRPRRSIDLRRTSEICD